MVDLTLLIIQPKDCLVKNTSISGRHGLVFQCDFFRNLAFHFQCSATFFYMAMYTTHRQGNLKVLHCLMILQSLAIYGMSQSSIPSFGFHY